MTSELRYFTSVDWYDNCQSLRHPFRGIFWRPPFSIHASIISLVGTGGYGCVKIYLSETLRILQSSVRLSSLNLSSMAYCQMPFIFNLWSRQFWSILPQHNQDFFLGYLSCKVCSSREMTVHPSSIGEITNSTWTKWQPASLFSSLKPSVWIHQIVIYMTLCSSYGYFKADQLVKMSSNVLLPCACRIHINSKMAMFHQHSSWERNVNSKVLFAASY